VGLNLPTFAALSRQQIEFICQTVRRACAPRTAAVARAA
jgi:hypothetical protein